LNDYHRNCSLCRVTLRVTNCVDVKLIGDTISRPTSSIPYPTFFTINKEHIFNNLILKKIRAIIGSQKKGPLTLSELQTIYGILVQRARPNTIIRAVVLALKNSKLATKILIQGA